MMQSKDIRWRQRFDNFEKSYQLLEKYIDLENKSELERAGIIHLFEITFELSWKVMKDYLESAGYIVKSPREAIKQAYQINLLDDGHIWIQAMESRNLTTHTYNEELAAKMVQEITDLYYPQIQKLYISLKKEL